MLPADIVIPEPATATPWWLAPAYSVLILAAVLIGVGVLWTIQAERRQSAEHADADAKARAELDAALTVEVSTGRHASADVAVDTGYVGRRLANTDATTDVIVMRPWIASDGHPVGLSRVPLRLPRVRVRGGWWKA